LSRRINKLRQQLQPASAFLISNLYNIRYLLNQPTLFDVHFNGVLLVTVNKLILFADGRYFLAAKQAKVKAELKLVKAKLSPLLKETCQNLDLKTVFFEGDALSYNQAEKLKQELDFVTLSQAKPFIANQRQFKEAAELKALKAACQVAEAVWEDVLELIKPGVTEKEVALELDYRLQKAGATSPSFATIVAAGANSALPHHTPGSYRLKKGDFVLIDFGAYVNGYCSDITRTLVIGKPTLDQKQLYQTVLAAQKRALAKIKPKVEAKVVAAEVQQYFQQKGVAQFFSHSLGHGIGLEVHERPTLNVESTSTVEESMVVTVEPGLYLAEFGGVRIEDMVAVTETGYELLTSLNREFTVL
jgi:Xaa-Pro aminopeptidase